jgi:hypothetical protein
MKQLFYVSSHILTTIPGLMRMHTNPFMTKWILSVFAKMGDSCQESSMLPLILLFVNEHSSVDILDRKRKKQAALDGIEKRYRNSRHLLSCVFAALARRISIIRLRFQTMYDEPSKDVVHKCLECAEFKALYYLNKLSQRIKVWKRWPRKHLPFFELPQEFREVKGPSDPPHAAYSHLHDIMHVVQSVASPEIRETMLALFISQRMGSSQQLSPKHRECELLV